MEERSGGSTRDRSKEELPAIPETFIIDPSEAVTIQMRIESFFLGIVDFIGYDQNTRDDFVKIKSHELHTSTTETDDRIASLIARDRLIASVYARRTDFNFVEVSFALYLTPELVSLLRQGIAAP